MLRQPTVNFFHVTKLRAMREVAKRRSKRHKPAQTTDKTKQKKKQHYRCSHTSWQRRSDPARQASNERHRIPRITPSPAPLYAPPPPRPLLNLLARPSNARCLARSASPNARCPACLPPAPRTRLPQGKSLPSAPPALRHEMPARRPGRNSASARTKSCTWNCADRSRRVPM